MAKKFSFNNVKKELFPVELKDGTVIHLTPPSKGLLNELQGLSGRASDSNVVYDLMEMVLNQNRERKIVSREEIEKFDLYDAFAFVQAYYEYMNEMTGQKN